jgi:drug/metabolite transporter (DMT)-like permease
MVPGGESAGMSSDKSEAEAIDVVAPATVEAAIEEDALPDPPVPTHMRDHPLLGIFCKTMSVVLLSVMAAGVKWLAHFPTGQIVFYRSFFALIPIVIAARLYGGYHLLGTTRPDAHAIRSGVGVLSMFLGFTALGMIPFADATAISFASPIFTVLLASMLLGERVHAVRWSAVAVGFAGILVMIGPHLEFGGDPRTLAGYALALGGIFCVAIAMIFIRKMSAHEHSITIAFYFSVACALAGLLTLPFGWGEQTLLDTAILIGCGLIGGVGQLFLSFSYRYAEASLVAPFEYVAMIVAIIMGYFVFGEIPAWTVLVGATIVMAAGLVIVWRERRAGRA